MGTLNRIVNIAVLVLAIVSAIIAFKLKSKSSELVDGWKSIAKEVKATAGILDDKKNSGTKTASTIGLLDYKNPADAKTKMVILSNSTKAIIAQRNALASALNKIGQTLAISTTPDSKELCKVKDYKDKNDALITEVVKVQERGTGLVEAILAMGRSANVTMDKAALEDNAGYQKSMSELKAGVDKMSDRFNKYERHIVNSSKTLGLATPVLESDDYKSSLNDSLKAVEAFKNNFEATKRNLTTEQSKVEELVATVENKVDEISKLEQSIEKKNHELAKLNKILYGGESIKPTGAILQAGDPKALKMLEGKIVEINTKWDFVVVDLGKKTKVIQKLGKGENTIEAPLPNNEQMIVARGLGKENQLVGKIKIVEVHDYCAIANVIPSGDGLPNVQVGDIVYFGAETIKKFEDARKASQQ